MQIIYWMDEEIFDNKQFEENLDNKRKLFELIASRDAILMVGAGCSASLYPSWRKLIDELEKEAKTENPLFDGDKRDYLKFANLVKKELGKKKYYALLHRIFKPNENSFLPFHKILCSLPFKGITTTNYDTVLESALLSVEKNGDNFLCMDGFSNVKIYEFILSLNKNSDYPRRIMHLHGRYDMSESIILCEEEYKEKYGFTISTPTDTLFDQIKTGTIDEEQFQKLLLNYGYVWSLRRKLLWSLLATRRVVFFGFSMTDPYFVKMFEFVSEDLSSYSFSTHYLVLRITKENKINAFEFAERLKHNYGIETVFFEDDESFEGLANFISEIGNEILPKEEVVGNIGKPINKSTVSESSDKIKELLTLNKKQIFNED